ncbi:A24 family peptidase [Mycobacterium sp.]|uniref:A24 family peptidase n=1 Tax=Mycobacterium sp. TaxID=1785 RepID=UPI003C731D57
MGAGVCVVVLVWLAALSIYDVWQRRLPNWLTLPGAAAVLMAAALAGRGMPALAGAAALGLLYLLVHAVAPAALGAGDVKLAVGAGALSGYFGVDVWLLAALAAPLLTAVWSLLELARRGARTVPHGPAMCAATAAAAALALL